MVAKGSQLAHVWQAADNGDWAEYLKAMAGISPKGEQSAKDSHNTNCQSSESPLAGKPALPPVSLYEVQVHPEIGEAKTNRFDGTLTYALKGLL
ncbi:hypothetical protein [Ferrimonas kyonanensis]|uniref:hypothetical protein n=1 Tax=Ferrimonas kyonanensis TaxID=364763 RepID=UPI00048589FF|nr:hypothetical protein [Ferrimonas kyonanensis]